MDKVNEYINFDRLKTITIDNLKNNYTYNNSDAFPFLNFYWANKILWD